MACGRVRRAGVEQGERVVEPRRQAGGVEHAEPRGGELDRQRKAAEAAAEVRDRGAIRRRERDRARRARVSNSRDRGGLARADG